MDDYSNLDAPRSTLSPFVKVRYWFGESDLKGIEEFSSELSESYSTSEVEPGRMR